LREKRAPKPDERASAVKIAQMLEKAKYRERSVHIRKTQEPLGKLNTRNAVQNSAMKSMGLRGELPAWKSKSRKHTDDPTLTIGIMVDISGSMGSAMDAMATTAWVLGEAGRRVQAKTAMVYFGQDVFATLKVGQRLDEVSVYSAPDGTEVFGKGFSALNGTLGLTYASGVRLLVIVSDGNYTREETKNAEKVIADCERNGVAVLFITPKDCYSSGAQEIVRGTHAVHLDGMEVGKIALEIGKSASDALAKIGGGV
jgi:Mg-chelatase subunit ChlD